MATRKVVNKNVSAGSQLTISKHYVEQVTKLHIVSHFFNAGQHGNLFPTSTESLKNVLNNRPIICKFQQSFCLFPVAQKSDLASEKASEIFCQESEKNTLE